MSVSAIEKLSLSLKSRFLFFVVILNSFSHDLEMVAVIIPVAETFCCLSLCSGRVMPCYLGSTLISAG